MDLISFYRFLAEKTPDFRELKVNTEFLISMIETFLKGEDKFILYSKYKCWGVDNFYIGGPQNMHKLISKFHFNLDETITKEPSQEFLVFDEIKRMEND